MHRLLLTVLMRRKANIPRERRQRSIVLRRCSGATLAVLLLSTAAALALDGAEPRLLPSHTF
jgi:hypothetical protein